LIYSTLGCLTLANDDIVSAMTKSHDRYALHFAMGFLALKQGHTQKAVEAYRVIGLRDRLTPALLTIGISKFLEQHTTE